MKSRSKVQIAYMALFSLLYFVGILIGNYLVLISITAIFFPTCTFLLTDKSVGKSEKNRSTAMLCSFIPGVAHLYLRQYRRCTAFFAIYAIMILTIMPMTYFYDNIALFSLIIGMIGFNWLLSLVDTEYVCNRLELPYGSSPYELKIKNYNYAYIASVSPLFIPLFCALFSILNYEVEKNELIMYFTIFILLTIGIFFWIAKCLSLKNYFKH